jgi:hypothetical protein
MTAGKNRKRIRSVVFLSAVGAAACGGRLEDERCSICDDEFIGSGGIRDAYVDTGGAYPIGSGGASVGTGGAYFIGTGGAVGTGGYIGTAPEEPTPGGAAGSGGDDD